MLCNRAPGGSYLKHGAVLFASWIMMMVLAGCTMPKVDLSGPGWKVWSGQARWKPDAERPALAGELLAARHTNGDTLIIFSKPPFPIFTAQTTAKSWKIEFVEKGRSYWGRGQPPERFVWFRVPGVLEGEPIPEDWRIDVNAGSEWSMTNRHSGEAIRLVLDQ